VKNGRAAAGAAAATAIVALPLTTAGVGSLEAETGAGTTTETSPPPSPVSPGREQRFERVLTASRRRERYWRHKAHLNWQAVRKLRSAFRLQVRLGGAPGLERGLLCIHGFEGSWGDRGAPYWGGLQMDRSFMATYGREFLRAFGTADRWTPAMQLATAERAYFSGRGFGPWPVSRRRCGL
jgi:hypothetical protein